MRNGNGGRPSLLTARSHGPRGAGAPSSSWMTNHCGGPAAVTLTRFDSPSGILEGHFERAAVGYSCGGIDAYLSVHFRVCYVSP